MGSSAGDGVTGAAEAVATKLAPLRLALYRLEFKAATEIWLPAYAGSTFRGGFGAAFRRIACPPGMPDCPRCVLATTCPYALVFETPPPPHAERLLGQHQVPRPFVLRPPVAPPRPIRPGDAFDAELVLAGGAIACLPYFVVAFRELGAMGIGRGRGRFHLERVTALDPVSGSATVVYEAATGRIRAADAARSAADVARGRPDAGPPPSGERADASPSAQGTPETIRIAFLTPTRLAAEGHLRGRPEFGLVVRALLRRLSALALVHAGTDLALDYAGLLEGARSVRLMADQTRWHDWERYSSRQGVRMKLGGIVGRATYRGEGPDALAPYLPLLRVGELIHIGKNTTFGLGQFRLG